MTTRRRPPGPAAPGARSPASEERVGRCLAGSPSAAAARLRVPAAVGGGPVRGGGARGGRRARRRLAPARLRALALARAAAARSEAAGGARRRAADGRRAAAAAAAALASACRGGAVGRQRAALDRGLGLVLVDGRGGALTLMPAARSLSSTSWEDMSWALASS